MTIRQDYSNESPWSSTNQTATNHAATNQASTSRDKDAIQPGSEETQPIAELNTEREPSRSTSASANDVGSRLEVDDTGQRLVDASIEDSPVEVGEHVRFPSESHSKTGHSRLDPITGSWTIFAPGRAARPDQFKSFRSDSDETIDCPFCHGNESVTPASVWSAKLAEQEEEMPQLADWTVRVVPNLFPAIKPKGNVGASEETVPTNASRKSPGSRPRAALFVEEDAVGGHEVIIEAGRHTRSLSELNLAEVALVFSAYAARMRFWRRTPGIRYISLFKNVGRDAGASLQHSHSQLIASNRLPHAVRDLSERMRVHHAQTGCCLQCEVLQGELEREERIIHQSDSLVAYCPHASRFPYMIRITTREHVACFEDLSISQNEEVARLTLRCVRWLEAILPGAAYNLLLHTSPPGLDVSSDSQHWSLELTPRTGRLAGYELGSGGMINTVYPESAASDYRQQARRSDPRHALRWPRG